MKKVLFIAPNFFGYYKEIIKELEKMSYEVDYFCDAPSNSNISKALGRINKKLILLSTKKYFNKVVKSKLDNNEYDFVFVIAGMTFSFTPEMIEYIKQKNKKAKFIIYQWDGENNLTFVKEIHKYFDRIYSFDRNDCKTNKNYNFLPLFYIENYEKIGSKNNNKFEYDVMYIGTAHPKKIFMINEMANELKSIYPKQFIYHYMPSKLKFFYHKIKSKEYKNIKLKDLKQERLSKNDIMDVITKSKVILDCPQAGQTGLTIRTIECLGSKRKLITTNKDIINYDFYNEKNILVYDGKIDINNSFFKDDYVDLPKQIYEKYSLRNWLKEMIK